MGRPAPALLLAVTLWCSTASAQDGREEARTALFRDGSGLAERGDWAGAAAKFREVVELRSAPKALIALAVAETHLGRLMSAKRLYEKAIADARAARLVDDDGLASAGLGQLVPRIPHVVLELPANQVVVAVTIDGEAVATRDAVVDLDPGPHTIVVEGAGARRFERIVTLGEKDRVQVAATFPPQPDATPLVSPRVGVAPQPPGNEAGKEASGGALRPGPLVVAGAGIASAGVGVLLWALGKNQESGVKSMCGGTTTCPVDQQHGLQPDIDASRTKIYAGDVLVGVGAAAVAGGAVWWALGRGSANPAPRTGVLVEPRNGGAWVGFRGSLER